MMSASRGGNVPRSAAGAEVPARSVIVALGAVTKMSHKLRALITPPAHRSNGLPCVDILPVAEAAAFHPLLGSVAQ